MGGAGVSRVESAERDLQLSTAERVARGLDVAPADLLRDSK